MTRMGTRLAHLFGLVAMFGLAGCGGNGTMANGPVVSTPRQFGSLEFTLSATKAVYKPGEQVLMTLNVKNIGSATVNFFTLGPDRDAQITQNGTVIWQFPKAGGYSPEPDPVTLPVGGALSVKFVWDQTDSLGGSVQPGRFIITAWYMPATIDGVIITREEAKQNLSATPIQVIVQTNSVL